MQGALSRPQHGNAQTKKYTELARRPQMGHSVKALPSSVLFQAAPVNRLRFRSVWLDSGIHRSTQGRTKPKSLLGLLSVTALWFPRMTMGHS